jgi:2-oxoglutarate ferredoxin oxidoreductase subunit gamma
MVKSRGCAVQFRFGGSGGQGLQLSAKVLAAALLSAGRTIALSQSYEPTSRGGISRSDLVVGDGDAGVNYPLATQLDHLVLLDEVAAASSMPLVRAGGLVLSEAGVEGVGARTFILLRLPFVESARRLGNERVANAIALGALIAASEVCSTDTVVAAIREETPRKFVEINLEAFALGQRMALARAAV